MTLLRKTTLSLLLFLAIVIWSMSACAPPTPTADAKGDWKMSGICEIETTGWEISYDESKERMTLLFWFSGGQCDYE